MAMLRIRIVYFFDFYCMTIYLLLAISTQYEFLINKELYVKMFSF